MDSSAKLSAFLALGCLSPRTVWAETARLATCEPDGQQQQQHGQQEGQQQQREPHGGGQSEGPQQQAGQAAPLLWREPQRGDTWRWLLMHLGIRDFFLYSALKEEEGAGAAHG